MDWRLLLVAFPVLAALSWVVFIIGRDALNQFQRDLKQSR
ncbi:MAG: photosystem II protein [Candidatus Synechococcus spongiarum 142]|uniref:Photosystem II reaction center protein Y n=1 Tax=Candidatus Synechococcus spongiarum 142 TaxID=1608213 RepID=A0A6N3X7D2_9SYNE|nr:MAG: photosystem II protein [Candidatus Synechococcus spongiarum 142]